MLGVLFGIHIVRIFLPPTLDNEILYALAFIPARFTHIFPDTAWGDIQSVTSWLTYMFIHNDWTHLIMNSAGLLIFGSAVAMRIGHINFLIFSAVCGIVGALVHLMAYWGDISPVIGASAAISGHIAGAIRFLYGAVRNHQLSIMRSHPKNVRLLTLKQCFTDFRLLLFVAIWVISNIMFAAIGYGTDAHSSIAWEAHLGGFFAGLFLFGAFDNTPHAVKPVIHSPQEEKE
ncbi:MAG: rhomboid family intramembrane serine protease [Pseudomonadota bacterium]